MAQATFDVELALLSPGKAERILRGRLVSSCVFEDRAAQGWGLIIRERAQKGGSLSEKLNGLLYLLRGSESLICGCHPILRVAVFNPNLTLTTVLDDLKGVCALGAKIEFSVYPVDD